MAPLNQSVKYRIIAPEAKEPNDYVLCVACRDLRAEAMEDA